MRNYFFYFAVVLTIAIAIGSLISFKGGLEIGVRFSDKILHVSAYCLLTISWLLAYRLKITQLKSTFLITSAVFIYGIIIEILQGIFTNNRQADLFDVFANLTGIAVAYVFFAIVLKK